MADKQEAAEKAAEVQVGSDPGEMRALIQKLAPREDANWCGYAEAERLINEAMQKAGQSALDDLRRRHLRFPKWQLKPPTCAPAMVWLVPILSVIAMEHGYCLAVHGSLGRDLDLIAVPWIDEALPGEELIKTICHRLSAVVGYNPNYAKSPEEKPHGRMAWSIYFDNDAASIAYGPYLDISITPRAALLATEAAAEPENQKAGGGE